MARNSSVAVFAVIVIFLLLLTLPVILFLYALGLLPQPFYVFVIRAATAAFLILPAAIIAAAIALSRKPGRAAPKPVHYPWEKVFGPEPEWESEPVAAKISQQPANKVLVLLPIAIIALLALLLLTPGVRTKFFGSAGNETADSITTAAAESSPAIDITLPPFLKSIFAPKNATPAALPKVDLSSVPAKTWQSIAIAAVALLLVATVALSRRQGSLSEIPAWLSGWRKWFSSSFRMAGKNKSRSFIVVLFFAALGAAIAAFTLRKDIYIALYNSQAVLSARSFIFIYKFYIAAGVAALIVIIAALFFLEKRKK